MRSPPISRPARAKLRVTQSLACSQSCKSSYVYMQGELSADYSLCACLQPGLLAAEIHKICSGYSLVSQPNSPA